MAIAGGCKCNFGPSGVGEQYTLSISGMGNGTCTDCANLNGTVVLTQLSIGCEWFLGKSYTFCGSTQTLNWDLTIAIDANGVMSWTLTVGNTGLGTLATWTASGIDPLNMSVLSLSGTPSARCSWPSTVSLTPVYPLLTNTNYNSCLPSVQGGNTAGSNLSSPFVHPFFGVPAPGVSIFQPPCEPFQPPA